MEKEDPVIVSVDPRDYVISSDIITNMANEFYGSPLSVVGGEENIDFAFEGDAECARIDKITIEAHAKKCAILFAHVIKSPVWMIRKDSA